MAPNRARPTQIRIRFFVFVLGNMTGPHSPAFGCTRGGVDPFRLRLEKIFGTRQL